MKQLARLWLLPCALIAFQSTARASDVFVVGPGFLPDVQTAVNLAADGDVVLVKSSTMGPPLFIDGKGVSVVADAAGLLSMPLPRVRNVPPGSTVVLAGFSFTTGTIEFATSAGSIRVQSCSSASSTVVPVFVDRCEGISFTNCTFTGFTNTLTGARTGFTAVDSSIVLDRTTIRGGNGLHTTVGGFPVSFAPAAGADFLRCDVFVSGGSIRGGEGLDGSDGVCGTPTPPTAGLAGGAGVVMTNSAVDVLDSEILGGPGGLGGFGGGSCFAPDGPLGPIVTGSGPFVVRPGEHRGLTVERRTREFGLATVVAHGEPGDRVLLAVSTTTDHRLELGLSGVVLFGQPARRLFFGTIDATGTMTFSIPVSELGPGVEARRFFVQGVMVDVGGAIRLASPGCLTFLDSGI